MQRAPCSWSLGLSSPHGLLPSPHPHSRKWAALHPSWPPLSTSQCKGDEGLSLIWIDSFTIKILFSLGSSKSSVHQLSHSSLLFNIFLSTKPFSSIFKITISPFLERKNKRKERGREEGKGKEEKRKRKKKCKMLSLTLLFPKLWVTWKDLSFEMQILFCPIWNPSFISRSFRIKF